VKRGVDDGFKPFFLYKELAARRRVWLRVENAQHIVIQAVPIPSSSSEDRELPGPLGTDVAEFLIALLRLIPSR
jgi:hypothetical protein